MTRASTTERLGAESATARLRDPGPTTAGDGELVLGRYRLGEKLGSGGYGVVWRAHDERLERDVAVKVIGRDHAGEGRAEREALAAARLNHPGIVGLYELGHDDRAVYLVSELVDGATLAELEQARALSDRDVARVGAAIADALAHAHERGVIHRDVKPGNVMVVAEPAAGAGFAKLADFGIARLQAADPLTATGDIVGTLAYMAPEQAEGRPLTGACDIYSLALTLYEAWTGSNPVRAASPAATVRRVGGEIERLHSRRPDLPVELGEVIDAALDADPDYRPPLAELTATLRECEPLLDAGGGLVEPETIERFGLTAVRAKTPLTRLLAPAGRRSDRTTEALHRLVAAAGAAAIVATATTALGPSPPVSITAVVAVVAVAVALLPRIGWIASMIALAGWLVSPEAGREGSALMLVAALAPVPLLLPRAGWLWSLPALAPLLGLAALAPMFIAIGGLCSTWPRRAGLAAAGAFQIAVVEALSGRDLLLGVPDGVAPRQQWEGSLFGAAGDGLYPLLTSPAIVLVGFFALFAAALGVLVRGRLAFLDAVATVAWGVALGAGLLAAGDLLTATTPLAEPRGAVGGTILGTLLVLAVTLRTASQADEDAPSALP